MSDVDFVAGNGSGHPEAHSLRKRKRVENLQELEIDPSLPEPLSKKSIRKSKKSTNKTPKRVVPSPSEELQRSEKSALRDINGNSNKADTRSAFGVWIGNLPFDATKETLKKVITEKANVEESKITRIHLPAPRKDRSDNRVNKACNKGFAYVDLLDEASLAIVIALSETLMGGRRLLIKNAKNFEGRPDKTTEAQNAIDASNRSNHNKSRRIFVGNLGYDVTKEDLHRHFQICGEISDLHMATFEDTGKCKGFAWVTFAEESAAEAAVRGYVLLSKPIHGAEDEEEDETNDVRKAYKENKKQRKKRPVNKIQGRQIRCEFAEDPSSRYKRRFGKGS